MNILRCENIVKKYKDGNKEKIVLDHLNFEVMENDFVSIMGKSGTGKTTLLNIISGLDDPESGSVFIGEKDITKMNDDERSKFRRNNIGFIFQNYNLIPVLNVEENIKLIVDINNKKIDNDFFEKVISLLNLNTLLKNMPNTLSGGEKQRVSIARALLSKPKIIIADEPTGNLDEESSSNVLLLLKEAQKEFKQTIILVTHDSLEADLANTKLYLSRGKINEK